MGSRLDEHDSRSLGVEDTLDRQVSVVSDSANLLSCLISIVRYDILKQAEKPKA
jgi:hypothetical protein